MQVAYFSGFVGVSPGGCYPSDTRPRASEGIVADRELFAYGVFSGIAQRRCKGALSDRYHPKGITNE